MSQACFGDFSVFSKMIHSTNPNTKSEKKKGFLKRTVNLCMTIF